MKDKKGMIILFGILILTYIYMLIFTDVFKGDLITNYLFVGLIIVFGLYVINLMTGNKKITNLKAKDKLVTSLVEFSDTAYIMMNSTTQKVIYVSNNIENVLGITVDKENIDDIAYKIFNIPIIKSELDSWNKQSEYVSSMIEYDNPKYNSSMWIRVKMFPYNDKNEHYFVVEVSDATKEHERQHLLVSQASDIKSRESQLNQITASSYDVEMNINLTTNSYDLKYFKKDNMYFGEEKRGTYTEGLRIILESINEKDREEVYSKFSIESLKEKFSKYELDSLTVRYRLGNEIKNNTWLESTIFFLSSKQGNKVSILTKNVTENAENIREQNVMLQNALNAAKQADKAKTNLISTISHDIRTPLTTIMGISESLINKDLSDSVRDDIININDSSNEMLSIIDGLLDPSNIEKDLIKKSEKEYSVLKMFEKIKRISIEYIGTKPVVFELNLDSNLPVILYGDSDRIFQAVTEVINNSIKHTSEGKITVNVRGTKKDSNVLLTIDVIDTGSGISPEKLNSIMNSNNSNTGIGSVKKIIKLLGGTFEIESKLSEYTKTTISITQKIVEDNKVREMMNNNKTAEEFSLKGKKILIVDDNKLNLKVTSRLLSAYDLDITLLESGSECIDLIKEQNSFDLILMDQMMPGLNGTETLNRLKEIEGFNTPVVVLTADAMEGQKEKYIGEGFDDYISKPIDKSELSRVLKKFVKKVL